MKPRFASQSVASHPFRALGLTLAALVAGALPGGAQQAVTRLADHVPLAVQRAVPVGRVAGSQTIRLTLTLPLRNETELDDLLSVLYEPNSPEYGQFLSGAEFQRRFCPSQADYDALMTYAVTQGFQITGVHTNRLLLDVSAPAQTVEHAFGLRLQTYRDRSGRIFRAPSADPALPVALAHRVSGIVGLDTAAVWHTHCVERQANPFDPVIRTTGSGRGGGLTPSDIKTAYGLGSATLNGSGQTLGLFELDGYKASDITQYETTFSLSSVTLENVLVDKASGKAGSGADEVTLDIELMLALASSADKIIVYEGPNSTTGVLDTYNKIATDNKAKQISTSWGIDEGSVSASTRNSENTIFKQMAAQGQSMYAAAGDSGAYDDGSTLSVDDPASQPYMTGVGGTSLLTNGAGGAWKSETTWNGGSISASAGGGGISAVWSQPAYQANAASTASKGSSTMRNVPDVSLNADPNNGYSIYYGGRWHIFGGTSCAAPLWAGFTALVNQQRAANSLGTLGFLNPTIYKIGLGTNYTSEFHDIADSSTNLYYPAVTGYDLATGWGSFKGSALITDLAGGGSGGTGGGGTGGGGGTTQPTQLLGNPGFENGSSNPSPWVATAGVVDNSSQRAAHAGSWKAWLDGYGRSHTDTLYQQVTLPAKLTSATLTFWLHIDTSETTRAVAYDTLKVQIRDSAGNVLATLATYSNLNAATGYTQKSFDLSAYKGQTIQVYLVGVEDSSLQTSFIVDDFALNVQ